MKYIDADKLIAEVERLCAEHTSRWETDEVAIVLDKLEDFIISLQQEQPEVELSADIKMEWDSFNKHVAEYGEDVVWLNWLSFVDIATHFYELGLNARKE